MRYDFKQHRTRAQILQAAVDYFVRAKSPCVAKERDHKGELPCMYREGGRPSARKTCVVGAFMPDDIFSHMVKANRNDHGFNTITLKGARDAIEEEAHSLRRTKMGRRLGDFLKWVDKHGSLLTRLQEFHDKRPSTYWDDKDSLFTDMASWAKDEGISLKKTGLEQFLPVEE